ncbi:Protein saf4 [Lithohypha guttulata]|nr:Protein saf4 [Lithohypha guttulata]
MQGFNMGRYIPPELEGVLSFNQASGKKPTNKRSDGSQTVRFECPFAIWCTNCQPEQIIGQGVRFNAEKKKVGNYYSTPIWSFRIKHTVCGGWIEIQTDPKNTEYVVAKGGRRRDVGENKLLEGEILIGKTKVDEKEGAFGQLEERVKDKAVENSLQARVKELQKRQQRDWEDPYDANKRLRREFRVGRRERQADQKTGEALQEKFGLGLDLSAPTAEDGQKARLIDFVSEKDTDNTSRSIFEAKPKSPAFMKQKDAKPRAAAIDGRKSVLYTSLKSNTRARGDPFLKDRREWHPGSRREHSTMPEPTRASLDANGADEDVQKTMTAIATTLSAYDSD